MRVLQRAICLGALMLPLSGFSCFAQVVPRPSPADSNTFTIPPLETVLPKFREAPNDPFSKLRRELGDLNAFRPKSRRPEMLVRNESKICAVPLLEAPVTSADAFNMPQLRPSREADAMPEAKLPAPACSKDSR